MNDADQREAVDRGYTKGSSLRSRRCELHLAFIGRCYQRERAMPEVVSGDLRGYRAKHETRTS